MDRDAPETPPLVFQGNGNHNQEPGILISEGNIMSGLVSKIEEEIDNMGNTISKSKPGRVPGGRDGFCGHAARLAVKYGRLMPEVDNVEAYLVSQLQQRRGIPLQETVVQTIAVISMKSGRQYLCDPVFLCMVNPDTGAIEASPVGLVINDGLNDPLVGILQRDGYFELTKGNLNHYLDLLTNSKATELLDPDDLSGIPKLNFSI